ncbi:hypothetical protein B0H14DRAFT_3612453, partial [Mycena olivaceomarginata]
LFNLVTYDSALMPAVLSAMTLGGNTTDVVACAASHIHGHKYQVVARSSDYTSDDPSVITLANQTNPLHRDTIQIESMGSTTLRYTS